MAKTDEFPPLMTDRSPSTARARREHEHPTEDAEAQSVARLNQLCEVEIAAARAYRAAAKNASDPSVAASLQSQADAHDARGQSVGALVTAAGGSPPREDEVRLTLGSDDFSKLSDADVKRALGDIDRERQRAYSDALGSGELGAHADAVQRLTST